MPTVLVVDDDPRLLKMLQRTLFYDDLQALPIAKALVEAMGGTIEMRSEPEGGSTVSIRLPARLPRDD